MIMDHPHRRGVLAALLASPAFLRAERIEQTTIELHRDFKLKIIYRERTITLTAEEIMAALEIPVIRGPSGLTETSVIR